ncbi:hypothetical protein Tco_0967234 [Tanacetum coccineum]
MPEDPYAYIMAAYEVPPSPDYIPGPEVPPSSDYIPGPEEPQSPPPLDFVLSDVPEYSHRRMSTPGRCVALPDADCSPQNQPPPKKKTPPNPPQPPPKPNADSSGYVPESDLEEELEEDDEDPKEDPADYPESAGAARQDRPAIARDDPYSIARENLYGFVNIVDVPPRCSTSKELDYDIMDTWDDLVGAIDEIIPTTLEGVNQRVSDLATIVGEETTIMYAIMEDAQDDRSQLRGRGLSMDASDYARSDVMSLRTTVVAQSALISELQSADHRRQRVISKLLASDHKRQVQLTKTLRLLKGLQTQMVKFQRQHGPAKGPAQPDAPGEAGSSS